MCKFCEGYDRKNSGKFAIYMTKWSDERGTTLSVDFDGFDESSDTDFEVNFCPMCGKQFKQVQESTELTEALETLKENGYLVEKVNISNLVENLSEVLLRTFDLEEVHQIKSTNPNAVAYYLSDGIHDVTLICEYNHETDILRVTLNYGDFEDTFSDLSQNVRIDKQGKIDITDKLDRWASDVMDEWTDAFSY